MVRKTNVDHRGLASGWHWMFYRWNRDSSRDVEVHSRPSEVRQRPDDEWDHNDLIFKNCNISEELYRKIDKNINVPSLA